MQTALHLMQTALHLMQTAMQTRKDYRRLADTKQLP